jgi:hypothetical protein
MVWSALREGVVFRQWLAEAAKGRKEDMEDACFGLGCFHFRRGFGRRERMQIRYFGLQASSSGIMENELWKK